MVTEQERCQTGNEVVLVSMFMGVPVAVEAYPDEKSALKRYEAQKKIVADVQRQQTGKDPEMEECWTEKSRVKTSCSGLPRCRINDQMLALVRGPTYAKARKAMPYVAVNYDDGRLVVVGFEKGPQAYATYDKIRESHKGDCSLMESAEDGQKAFSTDEISVAVGVADVVGEGDECQLV